MKTGAIVLCGGRSSRMGRAKALLPWRGKAMIAHVVETLQPCVSEIVVVTSPDLVLPPLPARIVRDRQPELGPLGGIREGLEAIDSDLAYATSTDAPFITSAFVKCMLGFGCAAAPEVDGIIQTLAAVYPKTLAAKASELLASQRMNLHFLLESTEFRRVRPAELPGVETLRGFNTPDEYLSAVRTDGAGGSVHVEILGASRGRTHIEGLDTAYGMFGDVLNAVHSSVPALKLLVDGALSPALQIALNGEAVGRGTEFPLGPGDRLQISDAVTYGL